MSVTRVETSTEHSCERCGRSLPKKPQGGRPYRFCPESADEPGTSCLELDKRERAALERAGLGELVTAFRGDRDALLAGMQPVLGPLQALTERLTHVEEAAIGRAAQADQAQLRAEAAQRAAERATREAEQRTTRAYELRDEALADRDAAVEHEQAARREADDAITRALKAEHARGQAQTLAEERSRVLQDEEQRRAAAKRETAQLRDQLLAAQREATRLTGELAEAGRSQAREQLEHQKQLAAAATDLAAVRAELGRTQAELRTAGSARDALQTQNEVLAGGVEDGRQRVDALRDELAGARADAERQQAMLSSRAELAEQRHHDLAATTDRQLAAADQRYQQLLAVLNTVAPAAAPQDPA